MVRKGKLSPAVYRRRRLVVMVASVVLVMLVGWVVSQAVGNFARVSSKLAQTPSASVSAPLPFPTPDEPQCDRTQLVLTAATDSPQYIQGQDPIFTLTLTNSGKAPCEVNVGTAQMEFFVTSGADKVFSSRDCEEDPQDLVKVIAPGKVETARFQWMRNRSVPGCTPVSEAPSVGPEATYRMTAVLGAMTSAPQTFLLLS